MLGFVFPGQGSQKVGMGKEIYDHYDIAKKTFQEADDALGFSISKMILEGPEDDLGLTQNSQPAILTVSIATLRALLEETGLEPNVVAGHSLGEYSALVCAGAISFADAVKVVHHRGQFMQEAVPKGEGGMAAIMGIEREAVEQLCKDAAEGKVLAPANYNGAIQVVIAGDAGAVERAAALAKERGATAKMLNVSAPFHCDLMKPAADKLKPELDALEVQTLKFPVIANVTAKSNEDSSKIVDLLYQQIASPVRWEESIKEMVKMEVKEVLEIGIGQTLTKLIKRIDKSLTTSSVVEPDQIDTLRIRAEDENDMQQYVGERLIVEDGEEWIVKKDGSKWKKDGTYVKWTDGMFWDFYDPTPYGF